jgi:hypothetical protein
MLIKTVCYESFQVYFSFFYKQKIKMFLGILAHIPQLTRFPRIGSRAARQRLIGGFRVHLLA